MLDAEAYPIWKSAQVNRRLDPNESAASRPAARPVVGKVRPIAADRTGRIMHDPPATVHRGSR